MDIEEPNDGWSDADLKEAGAIGAQACRKRRIRNEIRYQIREATGQMVTRTLPCGTPIPAGATCICNCVPMAASAPAAVPQTRRTCSCVPVKQCSCVPVHYWHPN